MTFAIMFGLLVLFDAFFLGVGLKHLREVTGPWTSDPHEYDDAWKLAHRA
jgi:hypothetical protein